MSVPVIETNKANLELMSGKSMLHILKDVTFQVMGGEVTAVVGPSGSGKTSLLMILGGLERATTGKVMVAGEDISTANEDQLAIFRRNNLGILFQNFHLIPSMSALENVSLALEIAETGQSLPTIARSAPKASSATSSHGRAAETSSWSSRNSGGIPESFTLTWGRAASARSSRSQVPSSPVATGGLAR